MTRLFVPVALLAAALAVVPAPAPAQQSKSENLGDVLPRYTRKPSSIVVLPFNVTGSSVEVETFPRIIRNDLDISGLFKNLAPDGNARAILTEETAKNGFDQARWQQFGAEYTVRGMVRENGGQFRVLIRVHDVASGRVVIDREFSDNKDNLRAIAHRVSDSILESVKFVEGIFETRLLFVTEKVRGTKEIAVVDADGFNARQLTSLGKLATTPEWGSNGAEYYYTSYHRNRAIIYGQQLGIAPGYILAPKGEPWEIAAHGGTNHSPSWSQAAGRLAIVLSKDGNSEIYTSGRSGNDLRRLTTTKFTEGSPSWAPDGAKVAFTSNEAGGVHLFMMNADGSGRQRITTRGSWNDAVSWSPKGDKMVFVSREGGVNDVFTYDLTTREYRRLTKGQGNNESPVWAPNGVHIAFASNRTGQWQIYLMLDDGSAQRQLTTSGRNTQPDWGPRPSK
jgi:TolB protein